MQEYQSDPTEENKNTARYNDLFINSVVTVFQNKPSFS